MRISAVFPAEAARQANDRERNASTLEARAKHVNIHAVKAVSRRHSSALRPGLYTCINGAVPASSITQTSSSAVIQLLRQSLDHGRWSPGAPLRQEEIAAEFGVS